MRIRLLTVSVSNLIRMQCHEAEPHKLVHQVTGHNPHPPARSESLVQWQDRMEPTESHIADLKAKFQDYQQSDSSDNNENSEA